ncbi:MAG TPA: universal stress protein [Burkholderiales bacterium]|nr:universal stress protein [Burkholderiales bacterium]
MYKRIFVPVDGSETSARGLKEALKLAKQTGARLRLLHVIDESVLALTPEVGVVDIAGSLMEAGKKTLKRARSMAERHGIKTDSVMPENFSGRVADVILNEARKWRADVIVMGTHGRRGVSHMLLGSDAEGVVRGSTVPVLLVRGKAAARTASARKRR